MLKNKTTPALSHLAASSRLLTRRDEVVLTYPEETQNFGYQRNVGLHHGAAALPGTMRRASFRRMLRVKHHDIAPQELIFVVAGFPTVPLRSTVG